MARILHLEDDDRVRKKFADALRGTGHMVIQCDNLRDAFAAEDVDLYVCGLLGKYSDGLGFATEMVERGKKVLTLSDRQKFSRIPFLDVNTLYSNEDRIVERIKELLAGD